MTIVSTYDLLVTAIDNLKTDAAAADASTATKSATRDLAIKLGNTVEAALKNEGARVRERAAQAAQ